MEDKEKAKEIATAAAAVKSEMPEAGPAELGKALGGYTAEEVAKIYAGETELVHDTAPPASPSGEAKPAKTTKVREVIPFGKRAKINNKPIDEQSKYERRNYMRPHWGKNVDETAVTHLTSHTKAMIIERGIKTLQKMYLKRDPPNAIFHTGEIETELKVYGPGKGDIIRGAMHELQKQGKGVIVHRIELGRTHRFEFELTELPASPVATLSVPQSQPASQ